MSLLFYCVILNIYLSYNEKILTTCIILIKNLYFLLQEHELNKNFDPYKN